MTTTGERTALTRLVRRAGFGATPAEVDAVERLGVDAWLRDELALDPATDPGVAATPPPDLPVPPPLRKDADTAARRARSQARADQDRRLTVWWLQRMVAVEHPLTEKLTLGWHQHFATSVQKVRVARLMLAQNETLRRLGRGSFTDLTAAMVTDAAMLRWLDGASNTAKAPNENLSRELIELFTLGHGGGYTEQDVRQGARALSGWVVAADGTTTRVPRRHDAGVKTVLGHSATLGAGELVEVLLAAPAAAAYLVTRWWRWLVSPAPPPPESLARAVAAYGVGRDLSAMFTALLTDPHLASEAGTLVVTPVEWLVGAARALRIPRDAATVGSFLPVLKALGQTPFAPPSVAGWPSGQAWLSTASAATRLEAARRVVARADLAEVRSAPSAAARLDTVAHVLGISHLSDRTAAALRTVAQDPAQLVATALVSPEYLVS